MRTAGYFRLPVVLQGMLCTAEANLNQEDPSKHITPILVFIPTPNSIALEVYYRFICLNVVNIRLRLKVYFRKAILAITADRAI